MTVFIRHFSNFFYISNWDVTKIKPQKQYYCNGKWVEKNPQHFDKKEDAINKAKEIGNYVDQT